MWREFVELAEKREEPFVALCARFGISRKTGYKWLNRFRVNGQSGLQPLSRRPKSSPRKTPAAVVAAVLALRRAHPDWSVARLHARLAEEAIAPLPAPSTIDLILRRQRQAAIMQQQALGADAQRFEPNFRWHLCLAGDLQLADGTVALPVSLHDEATGFWVGATLQTTRREEDLESFLGEQFCRHGLPWRIVIGRDAALQQEAAVRAHTRLTVWLMRLGILVEFSFAKPPSAVAGHETRRLAERLARLPAYQQALLAAQTLPADPLLPLFAADGRLTEAAAREKLEQLREQHNFGGRQEAMQRRTPIALFRPSPRVAPAEVPEWVFPPEADVRLVSEKGIFTLHRRLVHVGRVFAGQCVELKPTPKPEGFVVLFAGQCLGLIDLSAAPVDSTTSLSLQPL